ncbi:ABC transporter permease [Gracilinema caldarium]|uniref:ABC transporter permease n=1 Tax=Gracilinema caldarium TaxID=215591 RepID=UPI0026ECD133|nr:ABC transporter permease [Gracilinema caldarium]
MKRGMKQHGTNRTRALLSAMIPLGGSLLIVGIIIMATTEDPGKTLIDFFAGPWSSPWFIGNTLDLTALLAVSALGIALSFKGGTFNLGGEGQMYIGGLGASVVLLSASSVPGPLMLLIAALVSIFLGALMGGISGLLKRLVKADELITSFLLSAALTPVADFIIAGPLRDKAGNLLASPRFVQDRILLRLLPPSNLSVSLLFAILLIFASYVLLYRTPAGYRFRIAGAHPEFAHFGGFPAPPYWTYSMAISGALHGLTGFFAVAGTYGLCHQGFPGGLGWSGIAVALIGRNEPLGLFPAALIFAWLKAGSDRMLLASSLQVETSAFVQAVIMLLVTIRMRK